MTKFVLSRAEAEQQRQEVEPICRRCGAVTEIIVRENAREPATGETGDALVLRCTAVGGFRGGLQHLRDANEHSGRATGRLLGWLPKSD